MLSKIKEHSELREILRSKQAEGAKVVFTNGCFDVLHLGHIRYLKKAKACGDLLVVALNSDASIQRLKGVKRPLYTESERTEIIAALEMVDYVTVFDEDDPRSVIAALQPDILVKGGDYKIEEILGRETVREKGGEVKAIPFETGFSTSALINTIVERFG